MEAELEGKKRYNPKAEFSVNDVIGLIERH